MVQSIVSKISEMFEMDGQKFATLLEETGSIIAGSFPLAYLTEWSFEPNDMDVWIPLNKEHVFFEFLLHNGFEMTYNFDLTEYTNSNFSEHIYSLCEMSKNDKRIQLIMLNDKIPNTKDVLDKFDYNICKVGFDGKNTIVSDEVLESIKRREVKIDIEQLLLDKKRFPKYYSDLTRDDKEYYDEYTKELWKHITNTNIPKNTLFDETKYLHQSLINSLDKERKHADERNEQRKQKYEARGFKFV